MTPDTDAEVLRMFHANPKRFSAFKASRKLGLPMSQVIDIVRKNKDAPMIEETTRHDGHGREDLRPYIVAKRRAMGEWDNTDPNIIEARGRMEAGTHIMTTHRDGPWLLLLSIPRKHTLDPHPNYFQQV